MNESSTNQETKVYKSIYIFTHFFENVLVFFVKYFYAFTVPRAGVLYTSVLMDIYVFHLKNI